MNTPPAPPWWKYPLVWLVVGLPAAVILAGLGTVWIALDRPDAVVDPDYYRKGLEINRSLVDAAQLPAQTGRNHVTTPGKDLPRPAGKESP